MRGYVLKSAKQQGIYIIFGRTGKCYVGQSIDLHRRLTAHKYELKNNKHKNKYLQAAYNKYGDEFFSFEIVELVENREDLNQREQFYIDEFDSFRNGYNLSMVLSNESTSSVSKGSRPHTSAKVKEYWCDEGRRKEHSIRMKARFAENPDAKIKLAVVNSDPKRIEEFVSRMERWRATTTQEQRSEFARLSAANRTPESKVLANIKQKVAKIYNWFENALPKHNKMGFKNIAFSEYHHKGETQTYVVCTYKDTTGKRYSKKFCVDRLGLFPAVAAACKWRDLQMIPMYAEFLWINDKENYETTRIRYGLPHI